MGKLKDVGVKKKKKLHTVQKKLQNEPVMPLQLLFFLLNNNFEMRLTSLCTLKCMYSICFFLFLMYVLF